MAIIKEDYVSFETAKLLKEKGFDEGCSFVVNTISKGVIPVSWPTTNSDIEDEKASLIALPTLQMAMKWLREVHNLQIQIAPIISRHKDWTFGIYKDFNPLTIKLSFLPTYEESVEVAIKYCLENLI